MVAQPDPGPVIKTNHSTRSLILLAVLAVTGCRTAAVAEAEPALLDRPSAETRAELRRLVTTALGGVEVTLSDDALTETSVLVIERKRRVAPDGTLIMGRDLGGADRFLLLRQGERCLLEHAQTGERWELTGATCVPVAGPP
jgi:hypothetical protein